MIEVLLQGNHQLLFLDVVVLDSLSLSGWSRSSCCFSMWWCWTPFPSQTGHAPAVVGGTHYGGFHPVGSAGDPPLALSLFWLYRCGIKEKMICKVMLEDFQNNDTVWQSYCIIYFH